MTAPFPQAPIAGRVRAALYAPGMVGALAALPALALAGPGGEQVVAGSAAVSRPDAATTRVDQASARAIINWQQFSVGGQELVQFNQPSTGAVAPNRVVGQAPSAILGRLQANGRVFLVNPHGVTFAPGAEVDVAGLVASALDIRDEDFLAGRYLFAAGANAAGAAAVVNQGTIRTTDGGFVVLAGERVDNGGLIAARLGQVVLAAGRQVTLDVTDTGLVGFAIDAAALAAAAGVANAGVIEADGGTVVMSARLAGDLAATAVNNAGLVQARAIETRGGRVFLSAAGGGVEQQGTLDASGTGGADGGRVVVRAAGAVSLRDGSRTAATGDGGGAGGMVEVSGHGLRLKGRIETGGGRMLVDPPTLAITNANGSPSGSGSYGSGSSGTGAFVPKGFIEGQLNTNTNTNVTLVASSAVTAASGSLGGPAFTIVSTGTGALAIRIGTVAFNSAFGNLAGGSNCGTLGVCTGPQSGGSFAFAADSAGTVDLASVDFDLGGQLTVAAGTASGDVRLGDVTAQGNVSVTAGGDLALGNITATSSRVTLTGQAITVGDITVSSPADAPDVDIDGSGPMTLGAITATGAGSDTDSTITIDNTGFGLTVNAPILARNSIGTGSSGSAAVVVNVGGDLTVNAPITASVSASDNSAEIRLAASGNLTVNAALTASHVSGSALVQLNFGQNLSVSQAVTAAGGSSAFIAVNFIGSPAVSTWTARTTGAGLLRASAPPGERFLNIDGGEATNLTIDFRTSADEITLDYPVFGNAHIDNTAFTGPADFQAIEGGDIGVLDLDFGGDARFGGDIRAPSTLDIESRGGDIDVSGRQFAATDLLALRAAGNVHNAVVAGGAFSGAAGALLIEAGGSVLLDNPATVLTAGGGAVADEGDAVLAQFMNVLGITAPPAGPNAVLRAGGDVRVGTLNLSASYPHLVVATGGALALGAVGGGFSDILVQLTAPNPAATLGLEDTLAALQDVNFGNQEHLALFPGTTIAFGSGSLRGVPHAGDIVFGVNGPVDVGSKNILCLTSGQCLGLDQVLSSGIVAALNAGLDTGFNPPLPEDWTEDDEDDDQPLVEGDEGGGGGEGSVRQNPSRAGECPA